jgi:hypothetical protein
MNCVIQKIIKIINNVEYVIKFLVYFKVEKYGKVFKYIF